jgi:hypothetical protein
VPDEVLVEAITRVLEESPLLSEGHKKVTVRLRRKGLRVGKNRVLRLMRVHGWLVPVRRVHERGDRAHEGTVRAARPDEVWGTDATRFWTEADGWCWFFGAVDHCTTEPLGGSAEGGGFLADADGPARRTRGRRKVSAARATIVLSSLTLLLWASASTQPVGRVQEAMGPWRLEWAQRVSADARAVFSWGEDIVALHEPRSSKVVLWRLGTGVPQHVGEVVLRREESRADSGAIYPDPILRGCDGAIYWLSHAERRVFAFSSSGTLVSSFATWSQGFSMAVLPDGGVRVLGRAPDTRQPVFEDYRQSGLLIRTAAGWMTGVSRDDRLADVAHQVFIFLNRAGETIELAAWLPYARVQSAGRELAFSTLCEGLPAAIRRQYGAVSLEGGRPRLARGATGPDPLARPYLLAASPVTDEVVVALLNGNYLLSVDVGSRRLECWPVPAVCDSPATRAVHAAIASVGSRLALLRTDGCLSVWRGEAERDDWSGHGPTGG